ncbi:MAG TPA: hypothetical protein VHF50_05525 [Solirubrobacterales bacterium]|nr:hypothetical protein [Solirubrobacterales bacterium]
MAFLLLSRPPIDATVSSAQPRPNHSLWVEEAAGESPYLTGLLTSIALVPDHERGGGGPEGHEQEIVVPVPPRTCRRIAAALDVGCGTPVGRPVRGTSNLTLEFFRPVLVDASTSGPARLRLDLPSLQLPTPSPTAWTLDADARLGVLDVRCFDGARFLLIGTGIGASGRCVDGSPQMRIRVAAADSAEVEMRGVRALHLDVEGRSAKTVVDTGLLRVGDSHTPIRDGGGTGIALSSESAGGVAVGLDVTRRPTRSDLTLESGEASSVLEGKAEEKVPSLFSRRQELWLAVIFAAIALVATLWSDAFVLWR